MMYLNLAATIGLASLSLGAGSAGASTGETVPKFIITTVAGTGERGMTLDEVPAVEALIERPTAMAVDSKGRLYIADEQNGLVRMVTRDGFLTTVMGTESSDRQTKERLAVLTNIAGAYGVATDAEDNLYVLSRGHSKIFKVGSEGYARCIVGNGRQGFGAAVDGGPAMEAQLGAPSAIAIDAAGNLYIADFFNHRIRKVSSDGVITSIAGTGKSGYNGDGKPAIECQIGEPCGVAVDREGYVYIGDQLNNRVRVVTPGGIMHTVAGTGVLGHTGDGGAAELAQISNPDIIALDSHGNLYFPDHINCVVRKLTRVTE